MIIIAANILKFRNQSLFNETDNLSEYLYVVKADVQLPPEFLCLTKCQRVLCLSVIVAE